MTERKEINGVEQVCLALAVITYKAVDLVGKFKICVCYVLIIQN